MASTNKMPMSRILYQIILTEEGVAVGVTKVITNKIKIRLELIITEEGVAVGPTKVNSTKIKITQNLIITEVGVAEAATKVNRTKIKIRQDLIIIEVGVAVEATKVKIKMKLIRITEEEEVLLGKTTTIIMTLEEEEVTHVVAIMGTITYSQTQINLNLATLVSSVNYCTHRMVAKECTAKIKKLQPGNSTSSKSSTIVRR
jgi:hypothetical protein